MQQEVMSDWINGIVATDTRELIARPRMDIEELLASEIGKASTMDEVSRSYRRITTEAVMIRGNESCVSVVFHERLVQRAIIVVTENTAKRFSFVTGYASPSDGREVKFLDRWVATEVGEKPPIQFEWGRIGDSYDPVAGFARIVFIYD